MSRDPRKDRARKRRLRRREAARRRQVGILPIDLIREYMAVAMDLAALTCPYSRTMTTQVG